MEQPLNILVLPSWFPSKSNSSKGIFIKKHAEIISLNNFVTVLNFDFDSNAKSIFFEIEDKLETPKLRILNFKLRNYKIPGYLLINFIVVNFLYFYYILIKRIVKFDIINVNVVFHIGIYLFFFLTFTRKPIVITEHWTGYFEKDGSYNRLNFIFKWMISLVFKKATAIIAISESLKIQLALLFNVFDKIVVIPNALNNPDTPRISSNIFNKPFSFLVIGNFDNRQKGLTGILDAFAKLINENPHVKLIFAGGGSDFEMVVNYAKKLGLKDNETVFLGPVANSDIPELYSKANCYILNSNFETFSISTAEALLNGVPVISTQCNGPEEYVNEKNGILVDANDENALLKAMKYMISNFEMYDSIEISNEMKSKYCDSLNLRFDNVFRKSLNS